MRCAWRMPSRAAVSRSSSATAPCAWRAITRRAPRTTKWSSSRRRPMKTSTFALAAGIVYLALGILGLVPAALVPPPIDAPPTKFAVLYGYLLGLFPVTILHTGMNLVVGALGLSAWSGRINATMYARALAWFFGVLAVMGMLPMLNTTFGLMPLH